MQTESATESKLETEWRSGDWVREQRIAEKRQSSSQSGSDLEFETSIDKETRSIWSTKWRKKKKEKKRKQENARKGEKSPILLAKPHYLRGIIIWYLLLAPGPARLYDVDIYRTVRELKMMTYVKLVRFLYDRYSEWLLSFSFKFYSLFSYSFTCILFINEFIYLSLYIFMYLYTYSFSIRGVEMKTFF